MEILTSLQKVITIRFLINKIKSVAPLLFLFLSVSIYSQDQNYNWTKKIVYLVPTETPIETPTRTEAITSCTYLDGFNRPIQQINYQQSGRNDGVKDIVKEFKYDDFGRVTFDYLPVAVESNEMNFLSTLNYTPTYGTQLPYSEKEYDNSPFNKVRKIFAPGTTQNWARGSGHEIKIWDEYNGYSSSITDENGNITKTTIDNTGLLRAKTSYIGSNSIETTFAYDDLRNLAFVAPGNIELPASPNDLEDYCYQYHYDDKNRLIEKKLPTKQWEYVVYDALNRIIATGPVYNPFGSNDTEMGWLYTRYDQLSRVALTGWFPDSFSNDQTHNSALREDLQNNNNGGVINTQKTDTVTTIDGFNVNYTDQDLPFGFKILTVNYYDTYDFPIAEPISFTSTLDNPYYNNTTRKPTGLLTGTWVRVLKDQDGPINGEFKYILYNYRGQAILEHQTNFLGGFTRTETRLDFTGKPILIKEVHKYNSTAELLTVQNAFVYTPQGLIETQKHKINNEEWQTLAENKYTELGQLESKKTGATESLDFIQQVDYTYNIRGWLTGINAINSLTMPNQPLDFFAFKLNYDTTEDAVPNATAYYNGNISETQWRTSSDNTKRKYSYQYDSLNRLQFAVYQKPEANFPIRNSYNESIDYDVFGNIKRLIRNGNADVIDLIPNEIDSLAYIYRNNRLQGIRDNSFSPLGFKDIEPNNTNDYDYNYDNNGNLKVDFNKKITQILYNHLNLPVEIIFEGSSQKKISYIYNATGQKIQKTILAPSMVEKTTHYLNGLQYFQSRLQFIPTSEGYVNATTIHGNYRFNYVYNYLDHLGNVRLSYGRDPQARNEIKILEENHYYPYGLKHTNYNANLNAYKKDNNDQVQLTGTGLSADLINKYKFNGMEYQDELGLNLYDMDFRDYDPAIGRWLGIDPVTHFPQSPYIAFDGNPVTFADPSGADGVVYGMAGQSAWSNPYSRGHDSFGYANYGNNMPGAYNEGIGSAWGDGGLLPFGQPVTRSGNTFVIDWNSIPKNSSVQWTPKTLRFVGLSGSRTGTNASGIQGQQGNFVIVGGVSYDNGDRYKSTMTNFNTFSLGSGMKDAIIEGAIMLNNGAEASVGLSRYLKISKGLGVVGSVITTGYSTSIVYDQAQKGGLNEVFSHRDVLDAGVGAVGLGATGLAAVGLISNPVGWGIGIGVLVYGGITLISD